MDSHASSADTCTTVSLSQSLMHDDDDAEDDLYMTVTTELVKNLQIPFRSQASNHAHESFQYLQRMKPYNYIRDDDGDGDGDSDSNLSVGKKSCLQPFFFSEVPRTNIQVAKTA
jgi:hypothetical protein